MANDEQDGSGQTAPPADPFKRALWFQDELIGYFAGGHNLDDRTYQPLRKEFLDDPRYNGLAPSWLRKCRDVGALWSFAKSVDGSWEPRRQFVREQFEPLLDFLERGGATASPKMPGPYDASAWTGVQSTTQQAHAIKTLIPVAQAAVGALIAHLEQPTHNGGPPLDEVEFALDHLRKLHVALGELLGAVRDGRLQETIQCGAVAEIARYGRQAARALKNDPLPYALSGALLAVFTACGFPGLGGYLSGMAVAIRKPGSDPIA